MQTVEVTLNQQELAQQIAAQLKDEVLRAVKAQQAGFAVDELPHEQRADALSFGDFLKCVARNDVQRLRGLYKSTKALDETSGAGGGYLVPRQFEDQIRAVGGQLLFDQLVAAGRGPLVLRTQAAELTLPVLEQDQSPPAGSSALIGGVRIIWREQSQDVAASEPSFEQRTYRPYSADSYIAASMELISDASQALETFLTTLFGRAYAVLKMHSVLRGTGTGQPRGIVDHPATISVSRPSGTDPQYVKDTQTVLNMLDVMLPGSTSAVFFAHPKWRSRLMQTRIGETLLYVPAGQVLSYGDTLCGIPVAYSEHLPDVTQAGSLILADLSYYVLAERAGFSVAFSEHVRFLKRQGVWVFSVRLDGSPMLNAPLTYADGTSYSPFVQVAAGA